MVKYYIIYNNLNYKIIIITLITNIIKPIKLAINQIIC